MINSRKKADDLYGLDTHRKRQQIRSPFRVIFKINCTICCDYNWQRLTTHSKFAREFKRIAKVLVREQNSAISSLVSAKLHYTDIGYGRVVQRHQRTSSQQFYNLLYNKFTTSRQKFATSQCQSPTSGHVFVRWWWICCTTSCRVVVSSSVGGVVQHFRSRCPCSGVWHLLHSCTCCLFDYKRYWIANLVA